MKSALSRGAAALVGGLLLALIRLLTGVQARWWGCQPKAVQRLYFANHQSHADLVLIWASLPRHLRRPTRAVAARDYWARTAFRHWLTRAVFNVVYVSRERQADEDPLQPLAQAMAAGDSLILFPEGTRGSGDEPQAFKAGLYNLARQFPQAELIPTWITNVQRVMPKGALLPVPVQCHVTFGAPLQVGADEDCQTFLLRARAAVLALRSPLAQPLVQPSGLRQGLRAHGWWLPLLGLAWWAGPIGLTLLCALGSFLALREFLGLVPMHRSDHPGLLLSYLVVLPLQYLWAADADSMRLATFIPVLAFLVLPVLGALSRDRAHWLQRQAQLLWGLLACVYAPSHLPALSQLPGSDPSGMVLPGFLLLVVGAGQLAQHGIARLLRRPATAVPGRAGRHGLSWAWGLAVGSQLGLLLAGHTPFSPSQAFVLSLLACVAGALGQQLMLAIQQPQRAQDPAHAPTSLLVRLGPLYLAAPVFFHAARWTLGA